MSPLTLGMLFGATLIASAINAIAGGGSIISFPAAIAAGLPPVLASATNSIALVPGTIVSAWAYRKSLGDNARLTLLFTLPAVGGSVLGAGLLLAAPAAVFETVVPWLIFGATMLILFKDAIARRATKVGQSPTRRRRWLVGAGLLLVSVYGGYFGAGMGILTLALLSLLKRMSLIEMNAMKTAITAAINGLAAGYFLARGAYDGSAAVVMAAGSLAGGYAGASLAKRVNPKHLRWAVVAIGVGLSGILAYRLWGQG